MLDELLFSLGGAITRHVTSAARFACEVVRAPALCPWQPFVLVALPIIRHYPRQ